MMVILGSPKGSQEARFEALMAKAGIPITWSGYQGKVDDWGIKKVIKLRPRDIVYSVACGEIDVGLAGSDCIQELDLTDKVREIVTLPISRSGNNSVALALFVKDSSGLGYPLDLCGSKKKLLIATEWPNIAKNYLSQIGIAADIRITNGATESLVRAGFVDAGIDVVDSGSTLSSNQLRVIDVVMRPKAVLIANPQAMAVPIKQEIITGFAQLLLEQSQQTDQPQQPDFSRRNGLIIAVVQDADTKRVLMHAFMDRVAWQRTIQEKVFYRYSTSHQKVMLKGATSGNIMKVKDILLDCDKDACLISVEVIGNGLACHTGQQSCFSERVL